MEGPATAPYATLHLGDLVDEAYDGLAGKKLDLPREAARGKVLEFAAERLRGLLAARASGPVADAVLEGVAFVNGKEQPVVAYPAYAMAKAAVLAAVVERKETWLDKARLVMKRLAGIGKDTAPLAPRDARLSAKEKAEADQAILAVVQRLDASTEALVDDPALRGALQGMEALALKLDAIFNTILVNDPKDADTKVRLGVLSYGARCVLRIADFSKLG